MHIEVEHEVKAIHRFVDSLWVDIFPKGEDFSVPSVT